LTHPPRTSKRTILAQQEGETLREAHALAPDPLLHGDFMLDMVSSSRPFRNLQSAICNQQYFIAHEETARYFSFDLIALSLFLSLPFGGGDEAQGMLLATSQMCLPSRPLPTLKSQHCPRFLVLGQPVMFDENSTFSSDMFMGERGATGLSTSDGLETWAPTRAEDYDVTNSSDFHARSYPIFLTVLQRRQMMSTRRQSFLHLAGN